MGDRCGFLTLGDPELHCEPEATALLWLALDRDRAAHHLDQPLADRESEPGAAKPPCRRAIDLRERSEQSRHGVARDADPGVGDRHPQHRRALRGFLAGHLQLDLSEAGELQGVAHQVGEYLAHLGRVAEDVAWHAGVDHADQLETLGVRLLAER